MQNTDRGQPVEVDVGPCLCPGRPHTSDIVWLRARPDTTMRFALVQAITEAGDDSRILTGYMVGVYLRLGPLRWNLVDAQGKAVERNVLGDALGLERELIVANVASDLYTEAITGPLPPKLSISQELGPMDGSTSPPSTTEISSEPSSPSIPVPST